MQDSPLNLNRLVVLIGHLMDDHSRARFEAAGQIRRMGPAVVPMILPLGTDPRARMRHMAAYILGRIWIWEPDATGTVVPRRCPDGVPLLVRLLKEDPNTGVRAAAASSLGLLEARTTVPALCRAASDASAEVRLSAAMALGCFHLCRCIDSDERRRLRDSIVATLLRLMDDNHDEIREWATFGLDQAEYDLPEVHDRVWQAMSDRHSEVRGAAAEVLATFGDPFLMARLETLLREDRTREPYYFWAALTLGDPILLPAVRDAAGQWAARMKEDPGVRDAITWVIEALEEARSVPRAERGDL